MLLLSTVAGGGGSTWNPSDNSGGTLSNGNLTVSFQTNANTYGGIRGTTSKTSGKWMIVMKAANFVVNNGASFLGLANASAPLTNYFGGTNNGTSLQVSSGSTTSVAYAQDGTTTYNTLNVNLNDNIGICFDFGAALVWWQNLTAASGWTNRSNATLTGNPATGTGGTSTATLASIAVFPACNGYYRSGTTADIIILNTPCTGYTPPSGFSAWG